MLVEEGPCFLNGPCESASGDAKEPGEQVMDADLAEAEHGGHDPGLDSRQQPTLPLVQMREQHPKYTAS